MIQKKQMLFGWRVTFLFFKILTMATMGQIIGARLKSLREDYDISLSEFAAYAKRYGVNWSASTIFTIEQGKSKADSLTTLLILIQVLNDYSQDNRSVTFDRKFSIRDLLKSENDETVEISANLTVPLSDAAYSLTYGEYVDFSLYLKPDLSNIDPKDVNTVKHIFSELGKSEDAEEFAKNVASGDIVPSPAEMRAAQKLVIPVIYMCAICRAMYGQSLDKEVEQRAGENASPQKRGSVSRKMLLDEILTTYMKIQDHIIRDAYKNLPNVNQ